MNFTASLAMNTQEQSESGIPSSLLAKARRFCAYQERCLQETRRKMRISGASAEQADKLASLMQQEGFIDEKRFAEAFARGKFYSRQWGKLRIRRELLLRGIPEAHIDLALAGIDPDHYKQHLHKMLDKKIKADRSDGKPEQKREKARIWCIQKGWEPELVSHALFTFNPRANS